MIPVVSTVRAPRGRRRALASFLALWWAPLAAQRTVSPLAGIRLELDSVTAGEGYLVYAYRAVNPTTSKGGIAIVSIDLTAPRGTGFLTLPAVGPFWHGAGFPAVDRSQFQEHVPVGPISPTNWKATLVKEGGMDWYGARGGAEGQYGDSIGPGDSLGGFGLRSPFLPGIRVSAADPTAASCCTKVRPPGQSTEPEYPNVWEFRVHGWTVGPVYPPGKMTIRVMGELLGRACGGLGWISDGGACKSLRARLALGAQAQQPSDQDARRGALRAFLAELDARHGPGMPVSDNAYWLLKVNGEYLLAHM